MRASKTTAIFEQIKKDINNGSYSINEKLVEADLAAQYETSRNTIRSVLSLLEKDNLVTIEPHKGAKVVSLSLKDIINFMDLRAEVEAYIFRIVTPILTDEDVAKMTAIYQSMEATSEDIDYENYSKLNHEFHEVIYSNCDNTPATDLVRDLISKVSKYYSKTILMPGRFEATQAEHKNILAAVKAKDGLLAADRVRDHIHGVRETLIEHYGYLNQTNKD
ncbi:GntR family transcriptional regulator [Aerococcus agrisoli]|uniref:GntR family transcriptional regulator n=1 Tax=Aerococcus agrisoli TaxID=2487350 RepID=A0A3N4G361_9LACT|nr:GntR family transcriptional regulator [Aerococcus agrisoli]RPA56835.1 GntR family transcriptional regulator [Aerococcus agrisoli]